jgi:hypothetical protein
MLIGKLSKFALILSLFAIGISCMRTTRSFSKIITHHTFETKTDYVSCGDIRHSGNNACQSDAERCFLERFQKCMPAKLSLERGTIEGDPILEILFVEENCSITKFKDNSKDSWKGKYGDFFQEVCLSVEPRRTQPIIQQPFKTVCRSEGLKFIDCKTVNEWYK